MRLYLAVCAVFALLLGAAVLTTLIGRHGWTAVELRDPPTKRHESETELRGPPAEQYELQERCAKDAAELYAEQLKEADAQSSYKVSEDGDRNFEYKNHYNRRLNRCFALLTADFGPTQPGLHFTHTEDLWDGNSHKIVGNLTVDKGALPKTPDLSRLPGPFGRGAYQDCQRARRSRLGVNDALGVRRFHPQHAGGCGGWRRHGLREALGGNRVAITDFGKRN